jgi:GNAT superfamily N-acetyltransferase
VPLRIVEVHPSSKKDFSRFIKFPLSLYSESSYYVPHLLYERKNFFNFQKNPFFQHATVEYYLALSSRGEVLGRISAHIDWNYVKFQEKKVGFFGFFDSSDSAEVASALLETACDFHRKRGMKRVLGPMNFTTNDELGVLIKGFDDFPSIMTPYNYPYYGVLIEKCGFVKVKDLYAYHYDYNGTIPLVIQRITERVKNRSRVYLRSLEMKNFASDIKLVKKIYNSAWGKNWGFVPLTDSEIEYFAYNLKPIIDPSLALFAYVGNQPVGFLLALPDYNLILKDLKGRLLPFGFVKLLWRRQKIDRIRVIVMGIIEGYRGIGIESAMLEEIYRVGPLKGYFKGEASWILEDNAIPNRMIARVAGDPYKIYRIYGKKL